MIDLALNEMTSINTYVVGALCVIVAVYDSLFDQDQSDLILQPSTFATQYGLYGARKIKLIENQRIRYMFFFNSESNQRGKLAAKISYGKLSEHYISSKRGCPSLMMPNCRLHRCLGRNYVIKLFPHSTKANINLMA